MERVNSNKTKRHITIFFLCIFLLIGGFAALATMRLEVYIPLLFIGLTITIVGASLFSASRREGQELDALIDERLETDSDSETFQEQPLSHAQIFVSGHTRKKTEKLFEYIFIETSKPSDKAICMISRTEFEKDSEVLQCPNYDNYFLKKYLLGWLENNTSCPICKTILKTEKV